MLVAQVDVIRFRWSKRQGSKGEKGGRPHGSRTSECHLIGREMRGRETIGCDREGKEVKNTLEGHRKERDIYMDGGLLTGVRSGARPDWEGGLTREVQHRLLDYIPESVGSKGGSVSEPEK